MALLNINSRIDLSPDQRLFIELLTDTGFDVQVRHQYEGSRALFFEAYECTNYDTGDWMFTPHHAAGLLAANGRVCWMQGATPLGWCN